MFFLRCLVFLIYYSQSTVLVADTYDPFLLSEDIQILELDAITKKSKQGIPLKVYLPANSNRAPVIIFSHGLGGSMNSATYLGMHWAKRGYAVVSVQHTESDDTLWKGYPRNEWKSRLRKGINRQSFMQRMTDIPAVIDKLEQWQVSKDSPLFGRLDLNHIGMSGHSFGAITTQALAGQNYFGKPRFQDARIDAALALSPSVPSKGDAKKAFGDVGLPWLLMTGTKDVVDVGGASVKDRLWVYEYLPSTGNIYQLVLFGGAHHAFNDHDEGLPQRERNPMHHSIIAAVSTAFWDAYLLADPAAKAYLNTNAIKGILDPQDQWSTK